jgi:hypothetical protein
MCCTGTGGTSGQDLATLRSVTTELASFLEIDARNLIYAEVTNLLTLAGASLLVSHYVVLLFVKVKRNLLWKV